MTCWPLEITENLQAALSQFASIIKELEETIRTRPSITALSIAFFQASEVVLFKRTNLERFLGYCT